MSGEETSMRDAINDALREELARDDSVYLVGEDVARRIEAEAFYHLEAHVSVVGVDDTPIPFSPPLAEAVVPGPGDIEDAIRSLPRL